MGNYQEHLKRINPLREVDTGAVRTQLFGNPFKLEKAADKVRRSSRHGERMSEWMGGGWVYKKRRGVEPFLRMFGLNVSHLC